MDGNRKADDNLSPLVYELLKLAAARMPTRNPAVNFVLVERAIVDVEYHRER